MVRKSCLHCVYFEPGYPTSLSGHCRVHKKWVSAGDSCDVWEQRDSRTGKDHGHKPLPER